MNKAFGWFELFGWSLATVTLLGACASRGERNVAATKENNLIVIPAGTLQSEGYSWMSNYVIDKATKECYTQLTMYSAIKTDCVKLKDVPEASKALKEIGL